MLLFRLRISTLRSPASISALVPLINWHFSSIEELSEQENSKQFDLFDESEVVFALRNPEKVIAEQSDMRGKFD